MNISRNWLAKYVTIDCDLAALCEKLTMIAAENLEQAIERSGTKAGNKGVDAAMAAIEMVNLSRAIR